MVLSAFMKMDIFEFKKMLKNKNLQVDHINIFPCDNRLKNLRLVTKSENAKNRTIGYLKNKIIDFPIIAYKKKYEETIYNNLTDYKFLKYIKEQSIKMHEVNRVINLINKLTGERRIVKKHAFYIHNNDLIMEKDTGTYEKIKEFNNVRCAAEWLKEEEEMKAKVDTIRGNIWRVLKCGATIKGYLFKKGEEYTLKDDEIKKEINIEGKKYWVTNYGNILNESNLKYNFILTNGGYLYFKKNLVSHLVYFNFNGNGHEELLEGYCIDHKGQKGKINNIIDNLDMITHAENSKRARSSGAVKGQMKGTIKNLTTGESLKVNNITQAAEFLKKQKGYEYYKLRSLRTAIQKCNKDGKNNIDSFMDGTGTQPVKVYSKDQVKFYGEFHSIKEAINNPVINKLIKDSQPLYYKNIKVFKNIIYKKAKNLKEIIKYINDTKKKNKRI